MTRPGSDGVEGGEAAHHRGAQGEIHVDQREESHGLQKDLLGMKGFRMGGLGFRGFEGFRVLGGLRFKVFNGGSDRML